MILSIGEILADMVGENKNGYMAFDTFCGGAPFNLIVNAKQAGAKAGFIGCVGNDPIGRFVTSYAEKAKLDYLDIQVDNKRNTTLAFVTLTDGERDFAFYRHDTADYHINITADDIKRADIIHLGSLMLSESYGKELAQKVTDLTKANGKLLSFDMNFRKDIYKDFNDAIKAYKPYVTKADILKFSDDELVEFTGIKDMDKAIESITHKDQLVLVTMGSRGSAYYYNDIHGIVATKPVKPIDTTGAGDAFFGSFLAKIENKAMTKENIEKALEYANDMGAETTQFKGAIRI